MQAACLFERKSFFLGGGDERCGTGQGRSPKEGVSIEYENLLKITLTPLPDHPVSVRGCGELPAHSGASPSPMRNNTHSFSLTLPERPK